MQNSSPTASKKDKTPSPDAEALAEPLSRIATWIKYLGTGDAGSSMGAIEYLATQQIEAADKIYEGLRLVAEALDGVAAAIADHGETDGQRQG